MKGVHFLIPGDPDTRTGGYLYDRRIMAELAARGWPVALHRLDASFPAPTPAAHATPGVGRVVPAEDDSAARQRRSRDASAELRTSRTPRR